MGQYFTIYYTGKPFILFDQAHLISIGIVLAACLSMFYFRGVWGENAKRNFRYALAAFLVLFELAYHAWSVYYGLWTIQYNLPFHICSIFLWLSVIMLIKKSYPIYELAYFLGIGGAIQAVITPDAGMFGLPHFRAVQTLAGHGGIVLASVYMTLVEGYRPTWNSFKKVVIWTNIYLVFIFIVNQLIESNYMFVAHKPNVPTLIDFLAPWPWYILQLEILGLIICLILYVPFLLKDRKAVTA